MNKNELYDIARDAVNDAELNSGDIPAIDLYVDQILNLVSDRLLSGSERFYDRQLTKTMINNYSKDGLITPVKGKKYNREQIVQMLTVYSLKGTLTINEIKRLLDGAYACEGFDGKDLLALYDRHLELKEESRELAISELDGMIERNRLDIDNDIDYISIVCALASFSAHLRNIAQAMIDTRFPLPEEPKDEEKEDKEKDKEKGKEEKKERKEEKKADKKQKKEEKKESKAKAKEDK